MKAGPRRFIAAATLAAAGVGAAFRSYRAGMREAQDAWTRLESSAPAAGAAFDSGMVDGLPDVARRYFNHAIAPGTPLRPGVELEMEGTFLLGDKASHQRFAMSARQILIPANGFVWIPRLRRGPMVISGSDGLVGGDAWTRFWMWGTIPVARSSPSPDLVRSAQFRSAAEALWAPASLLPQNGVRWQQVGPDRARATSERFEPAIAIEIEVAADGAVREVVGQRWSDANPEKRFRLQPFGGTVGSEASFGGYTIPVELDVGNHYGTADYLPFFQARITRARHF